MQPTAIGPFQFGVSIARIQRQHVPSPVPSASQPSKPRNVEDANGVRELSRQIATEMLSMKGFIGLLGVTLSRSHC